MCERYTLISNLEIIQREFNVDSSKVIGKYIPNINLGLGEKGLVITNEAPDQLQLFRFGFTPFWSKKKKKILHAPVNGVRKEEKSIFRKPPFRIAIRRQRCLVLADAFISGTAKDTQGKPHLIYKARKNRPLAIAGLWDEWIDQKQNSLFSFALVTTPANDLLRKIGQEQAPLILNKEQQQTWLSEDTNLDEINSLLNPFIADKFNAYRISARIKKVGRKNPKLLRPIDARVNKKNNFNFYEEMGLAEMKDYTKRK